jgi:MYXO-CTERM domain-containing protein
MDSSCKTFKLSFKVNFMKYSKIATFAIWAIGSALHGATTFTVDLQADSLRTSGGVLASTGVVMLVADTSGAGSFGAVQPGASFSPGSFLDSGNKELVLFKSTISGTGLAGAFAGFTPSITPGVGTFSSLSSGNPLALLWFPALSESSTQASSGNSYGIYTGNGVANGSSAWVTPSSTSSGYKLYMFTQSAQLSTGTNPNAIGNATLTVTAAPEPSRAILAALGLGLITLRRRRR